MKTKLAVFVVAIGMLLSVPVCAEDMTETEKPAAAINRIGDIISTDTIEFTLKSFQFGYKLSLESDDTFYLPTDANKGLAAGDGKVYVIFDFDVTNLAKESISGTDVCGMDSKYNKSDLYQIDYKDGYIFDNGDYAALDLASISGNYNYNPVIDPLETIKFRGIIKCQDVVETDKDSPLLLRVFLPSNNGKEEFVYSLDEADNPQSESILENKTYDDRETISKVQEALNNRGYDCGIADGINGSNSQAKIQQYQEDNGLDVTGIIDDNLLRSLGIE